VIGIDEFVERLCRIGADRGPRRFPRRRRDREILMKSIRMQMDPMADYTEKAINALLERWRSEIAPAIDVDHVTLRRLLVDYGEIERTRDGATYRVGYPPRPVAFELEIDELDLRATIAAYRMRPKPKRPLSSGRGAGGSKSEA
jgi:hypothetical protein